MEGRRGRTTEDEMLDGITPSMDGVWQIPVGDRRTESLVVLRTMGSRRVGHLLQLTSLNSNKYFLGSQVWRRRNSEFTF